MWTNYIYRDDDSEPFVTDDEIGYVIPPRADNLADGFFCQSDKENQATEGLTLAAPLAKRTEDINTIRPSPLEEKFVKDSNILAEDDSVAAQIKRSEIAEVIDHAWDQKRLTSLNWLKQSIFNFKSDPGSQPQIKPKKSPLLNKMDARINVISGHNQVIEIDIDLN